jgi:two-component sensor histidine kinase
MLTNDVRRYGLALLILAVAIGARWGLDFLVPKRAPFITFFPAVLAAAWFCGKGPALWVLAVGSTATMWIWIDDPITVRIGMSAVFVSINLVIIFMVDRLQNAQRELKIRDEQLSLINQELHHRLKNLFAVTSSICSSTIKAGLPPDETAQAISGRIQSIARAQDLLSISSRSGAAVGDLIQSVVVPLAPERARVQFTGPPAELRAEDTTPFALILHELGTNALKYGAWSDPKGMVNIAWSFKTLPDSKQQLDFEWSEHDGPHVSPPPREGLGSKLIQKAPPGSTIDHDLKADGLSCRIRLALPPQHNREDSRSLLAHPDLLSPEARLASRSITSDGRLWLSCGSASASLSRS